MWEMVYKKRPFQGLEPFQIMYKVVIKRETLELDEKCHPNLAKIIGSCWTYDLSQRPDVYQVRDGLLLLGNKLSNNELWSLSLLSFLKK